MGILTLAWNKEDLTVCPTKLGLGSNGCSTGWENMVGWGIGGRLMQWGEIKRGEKMGKQGKGQRFQALPPLAERFMTTVDLGSFQKLCIKSLRPPYLDWWKLCCSTGCSNLQLVSFLLGQLSQLDWVKVELGWVRGRVSHLAPTPIIALFSVSTFCI